MYVRDIYKFGDIWNFYIFFGFEKVVFYMDSIIVKLFDKKLDIKISNFFLIFKRNY